MWSRVEELRRVGICPAPNLTTYRTGSQKITMEEETAFVRHFAGHPVWNAHVVAKATEGPMQAGIALEQNRWPMMCHAMEAAVTAPYLFEAALATYPIARDYFDGEQPRLYSMNAFWTQPAPGQPEYQDTHGWHRDGDDRKQLVLFAFGTDVPTQADGAHLYQRGTHRRGDNDLGRDFRQPPPAEVEVVTGRSGDAFLADTGGLHVGLRPTVRPRLLAWARWGVSNPPDSYKWDRLAPVRAEVLGDRYPKDPVLQEAIRLVVC